METIGIGRPTTRSHGQPEAGGQLSEDERSAGHAEGRRPEAQPRASRNGQLHAEEATRVGLLCSTEPVPRAAAIDLEPEGARPATRADLAPQGGGRATARDLRERQREGAQRRLRPALDREEAALPA